jgi:predicted transcriptional regulator of viral defense system
MIRGRYIYNKRDILSQEWTQSDESLRVSISRQIAKGALMSPWQNFYVAIPMEYRLTGEVPPSFYIDYLMQFLRRDYYVALLSAAALNGAGHQRAMAFQVFTTGAPIRSGVKNGTKLEFIRRKELPMQFIKKMKVQTGYINVSSPEMTALDIVCEEERIGGLSRAAEILVELAESISWDDSKLELLKHYSIAAIQRLGYLLDVIEESSLANDLMALAKQTGKTIRKTPLKISKPTSEDMAIDQKWKIIINQTIDIDEI